MTGRVAEKIKGPQRPVLTAEACNLRMRLATWRVVGAELGISGNAAALYVWHAMPELTHDLRVIAKRSYDGWIVKPDGDLELWLYRPETDVMRLRQYRVPLPTRPPNHVLPAKLRAKVVARDEGCCQDCGAPGVHVHHVQARALGGTDDPDNLRLLCFDCHMGSGWERNHRDLIAAGWAPTTPIFELKSR